MKRTFTILASIILLLLLITLIFFEIKDVPDLKKGSSYNIEKKDTNGLWLFHQMLLTYWGEENVAYHETNDFEFLSGLEEHLLILISQSINMDTLMAAELDTFLEAGNEVLLVGRYFNLGEKIWKSNIQTGRHSDSLFNIQAASGTNMQHRPLMLDTFITNKVQMAYFANSLVSDTSDHEDITATYEDLMFIEDSLGIFRKLSFANKVYHFHSAPELFTNFGSKGGAYLEHLHEVLNTFDKKNIVLHKFKRDNINAGTNKDSLLQYILTQRPLKYAYYLTLILGLIYVFFSSKRKQKEIQVIETTKNTSLEYIETMSSLFMSQNQNEKLVKHMKRNFYHKIKSVYFLNSDDPQLASKLSKKSKVPLDKIESILKQLEIVNNYDYNDDQLIRLYNNIHSFDQNRK